MTKAAQGHGLVKTGELIAGTAQLAEAVAWFERSHLRITHCAFAVWLGDAYLRQGKLPEARATLEALLATSREVGYRHLEGMAHRLLGEAAIFQDPAVAANHLEAALETLHEVGARNEFAKTLAAKARLKRDTDVPEARQLLEQALALFERLGTLDGARRVRATLAALDGRGPRLVIVSGSQRGLCQDLARDLQGIDDVNVVLDRREDGRHVAAGAPVPDERPADRRSRSEAGTAIQTAGFVIVAQARGA
jgi:tetratricopeptide (TPR) repeat protein